MLLLESTEVKTCLLRVNLSHPGPFLPLKTLVSSLPSEFYFLCRIRDWNCPDLIGAVSLQAE